MAMVTPESNEIKPIIARDDQDGRFLDDGTCHILDCPCADCGEGSSGGIGTAGGEQG